MALTVVALCCLGCAGRSAHARATVSRAQLRAELDRFVCALWTPEAEAWNVGLLATDCGQRLTGAPLESVSEASVARVKPLMMLAQEFDAEFFGALDGRPAPPKPAADALARDAFWRDSLLERATWLAAREELRSRGLRCGDCPVVAEPERIELSWAEFLPFLGAFVWPVQEETGGKMEIFVCSGTNGAAALKGDPRLVQAGFLAAAGLVNDEAIVRQIRAFADAGRSPAEVMPGLQQLLDSPPVRRQACSSLAPLEWFVGVRVRECPPAT